MKKFAAFLRKVSLKQWALIMLIIILDVVYRTYREWIHHFVTVGITTIGEKWWILLLVAPVFYVVTKWGHAILRLYFRSKLLRWASAILAILIFTISWLLRRILTSTYSLVAIGLVIVAIGLWLYLKKRRKAPIETPGVREERDSKETQWFSGVRNYSWKDSKVVPIVVCVVMIDFILRLLYPTKVWEPVTEKWQTVIILHLFYVVALTCLEMSNVWKARTAKILITMCIVALLTDVLGFTPWFGEKYWIDRATSQAEAKSKDEAQAIALKAQTKDTSATPSGLADVTYASDYSFPSELANNENARKVYDQLMADESLSKPDRYNLFFICGEETSYSYSPFEEDGETPLIGHNLDGTENGARGVCQVKPAVYGEIAKQLTASTGLDHSFETLEGQVRLASYVLRTHGGRQWAKLQVVLDRAAKAVPTQKQVSSQPSQGNVARRAEASSEHALMLQGGILVPVVKQEQIDRVVPMIAPIGGQYSAPIAWLRNTATIEALDGDIFYITENMQLATRLKKGEKVELKGANSVSILDARGLQYWQADEDRIHVIITRW